MHSQQRTALPIGDFPVCIPIPRGGTGETARPAGGLRPEHSVLPLYAGRGAARLTRSTVSCSPRAATTKDHARHARLGRRDRSTLPAIALQWRRCLDGHGGNDPAQGLRAASSGKKPPPLTWPRGRIDYPGVHGARDSAPDRPSLGHCKHAILANGQHDERPWAEALGRRCRPSAHSRRRSARAPWRFGLTMTGRRIGGGLGHEDSTVPTS